MSQLRLPYYQLSPEPMAALRTLKTQLESSPLGRRLIELIYLRVSQINGCAYCLNMHAKALRQDGETDARLDSLAGWRVSALYSERERAALAWAESVTLIAATQAPDDVFAALQQHFNDKEISDLTFAIAGMNALNRLAVSMRQ